MMRRIAVITVSVVLAGAGLSLAQGAGPGPGPGPGQGMGGMGKGMMHGMDDAHQADMALIHFLLDNGKKVSRTITELPDGVVTLTESSDPDIALKIRAHVTAMYRRLEDKKPIHLRDPLFRELFANADKVVMKSEATVAGVKVTETSADPKVAALIKEHAKVVSQFIENGRAEAMKNHAVPPGD